LIGDSRDAVEIVIRSE